MQNLWKQVADQYCTSAEKVQAEIAEAIRQGMNKSVHLLRKMCHIPETTQGTVKTVLLHFLGKSFHWERVLLHS